MVKRLNIKPKQKVLFIVSSTAQAEMLSSIAATLSSCEYEVLFVNTDKYNNRGAIEKVLQKHDFPHKTITKLSISGVKQLFDEEHPAIVVLGHDRNLMDRLFIKYANFNNIPTLLVQDGIMASSRDKKNESGSIGIFLKYVVTAPWKVFKFIFSRNYSLKAKTEIIWLELRHGTRGTPGVYGHGECSKIAVFGEAVKKLFVSEGIAHDRIVVTGNPKFDKIYHYMKADYKPKVCREWNIPLEKDIILLMTQYFVEAKYWSTDQRKLFITAVVKASNSLPNSQLIIKLHPPIENEKDYQDIVRGIIPAPIICKDYPLHELINASSIVVTVSSTGALEAMAMKKPVVIINLFHDTGPLVYKESGAIYVEEEGAILPAFQKALDKEYMRERMKEETGKFVYEQAYIQDGKATERIAGLIMQMIKESRVEE